MSKLTFLLVTLILAAPGCGSDETTTTNELGADLRYEAIAPGQGFDAGNAQVKPGVILAVPKPAPCDDCPIQPIVPTTPVTH
ncbi:MAG: hypothetical protein ACXVEF_23890 [Polyangiales bacterium]